MLHDVQPEVDPEKGLLTPLIPKVENFFLTLSDEQLGQFTATLLKTSFSNSVLQALHIYSKIGITDPYIKLFSSTACL